MAIHIKAKINFDIVEQVEAGVPINHLFDGFPPADVSFDSPEDKKDFIRSIANDEVLIQRAMELYNKNIEKEIIEYA